MNTTKTSLLQTLGARSVNILLHPVRIWDEIAREPGGLLDAFLPYAVVLGLIPPVMMVIVRVGSSAVLSRMGAPSAAHPWIEITKFGVMSYIGGLLLTFLLGGMMTAFAPFFGARKSWVLSCRILIFAATPMLVASVLGLIPFLGFLLAFLAIPWSLVLVYIGIGKVLNVRGAGHLLFTLATVILFPIAVMVPMAMISKPFNHIPLPMQAASSTSESSDLQYSARMQSGQATDTDIQQLVDYQINALVSAGQLKPEAVAATRSQMVKEMQRLQVDLKKSAAEAPAH